MRRQGIELSIQLRSGWRGSTYFDKGKVTDVSEGKKNSSEG
jgi:hypothetical protein